MTRRDTTYDLPGWLIQRVRDAPLERQAFPACPKSPCGPMHKWHGMECREGSCTCKTSTEFD